VFGAWPTPLGLGSVRLGELPPFSLRLIRPTLIVGFLLIIIATISTAILMGIIAGLIITAPTRRGC